MQVLVRQVVVVSARPCVRSTGTQEEQGNMATGVVKWFSDEKGFGFITPDESGKDLFVHHTDIVADGFRTLAEGTRVEFDTESGAKGPKAVSVRTV